MGSTRQRRDAGASAAGQYQSMPSRRMLASRRFEHGKILNWFGGATNATTRLLDEMHYRGLLRVARRDSGTRVYAPREPEPAAAGGEIPPRSF